MNSNYCVPGRVIRKSHTKSRRGCRACKARKVKCDERQPLCGNCEKRFPEVETCDFDLSSVSNQDVAVKDAAVATVLRPIQPRIAHYPSTYDGNGGNDEIFRLLELRLMYHYTQVTSDQLPKSGPEVCSKSIWSIDIPRLAFQSDLVLSALLGLSALHLSALTPADRHLRHASSYYFGKAVREHRTSLVRINDYSAEPLLAAAILITHHSWLAAHGTPSDEPYELPLKTYHMARGIQRLFVQMAPSIRNSGLLWFANRLPEKEVEHDGCDGDFFDRCQEDLDMISLALDSVEVDVTDKIVYEATVAELSSLYSAISKRAPQSIIQRRVATMPLMLPHRFLELVELKDPLALVLLARNLAMLKIIDTTWWLHGIGDHEVAHRSIHGIQGLIPPEWLWAMEWPVSMINGGMNPGL